MKNPERRPSRPITSMETEIIDAALDYFTGKPAAASEHVKRLRRLRKATETFARTRPRSGDDHR